MIWTDPQYISLQFNKIHNKTNYLHTAAFVIKGRFLLAASSAASLSVDFSLGFPVSVPSALEAVVSDGTAPSRKKPSSMRTNSRNIIFSNFSWCRFLNRSQLLFSDLNYNYSIVLDLRTLQEHVKKAFCFKNCSDLSLFK
jgi:hypothetical protein